MIADLGKDEPLGLGGKAGLNIQGGALCSYTKGVMS